ncbi:MAG TPA: methyltransferase domain-containing protein [Pyrinomonadaceae bacterium]|nr:methyltransferase domain-containing protein [Pyrinomonadaceae bacterium]
MPHLSKRADLDLFVDGFRPTNDELLKLFPCFDYKSDPSLLRRLPKYDAVIYQMGNDPRYHAGVYECLRAHPGVVVFHDIAFQFFFFYLAQERGRMNLYLDETEACHGAAARQEAEAALAEGLKPPHLNQPLSYPLSGRLARMAEAIIVHSEWCRSRLAEIAPATPIARINLPVVQDISEPRRPATSNGSAKEPVQIASFGHITEEKGIERTLRVLSRLRLEGYRFHYTLVGEPSGFFNVNELARSCGLQDRVTITGYVSLDEFKRRAAATDLAINLRESTVGETSSSLCRLLAASVPAIVSNVGWFSELPNDTVVKIDMDESADAMLYVFLKRLIEDVPLRARLGANARRYAQHSHEVEGSAREYISFIEEVVAARARRRFVRGVSLELARLGIDERDEDFMRGIAATVAELAPPAVFTAGSRTAPAQVLQIDGSQAHGVEALPERRVEQRGRVPKPVGIDYKRAAEDYPKRLDAVRSHYLLTKPFCNLATRPARYLGNGMDEETHRHFCDFANAARTLALPPGSRVLDVGCGSGWLAEYFARLGYEVCGIDISPALVEMARERLRRVPYPVDQETPLRCRFVAHDVEAAPLDETFDAAICYDSLHHFEDEHAALRHLSAMLREGGFLFIMEGDRPPEGSDGERELFDTMGEFGTLESPFSRDYLRALVREHGFVIVGDYVSVNGLFERELLTDARLRVAAPEVNYLLCKKATGATAAPLSDSRQPEGLRARITLKDSWPGEVAPGALLKLSLTIENVGRAVWLVGPAELKGAVMLGIKVADERGAVLFESHGVPPLPWAMLPGESANLLCEVSAPPSPGAYALRIDMVAQHVCWFEQNGSQPLVLPLRVL